MSVMISILNINIREYRDFVHVYFPDFAIIAVAKKNMAPRRLPLCVDPARSLSSRNEIGFPFTERLIEWVALAGRSLSSGGKGY